MSGFQGIFGDTNNLGGKRLDKYSLEEKMKDEQIAFCPAVKTSRKETAIDLPLICGEDFERIGVGYSPSWTGLV